MRRTVVLSSLLSAAVAAAAAEPSYQTDDPASPPAISAETTRLMDLAAAPMTPPTQAAPICGIDKALETTARFCNGTPLQLLGTGAASLYPSDIAVSGLTGVITDVKVQVLDVTHSNTSRITARVQHPGGQLVGLTGSGFDIDDAPLPSVFNADWTFADDAQVYAFPENRDVVLATTVPTRTNRYLPRVFAASALPAPAPTTTVQQMLSSLKGTNPNGTWRLWAAQYSGPDPQASGTISDGWCLDITTAPVADTCYYTATRTGSLNIGDVQQAGRIKRDGKPSLCTQPAKTAILENTTPVRRDRHDFPAISSQPVCLTVTADFTQCGGNQTQIALYGNYNPATPNTGHLGDSGYSTIASIAFSRRLAANQPFSVVVSEVDAGQGCNLYTFRLEANTCSAPPAGDRIFYGGFQLVIPI
jgi:hypothetical protein